MFFIQGVRLDIENYSTFRGFAWTFEDPLISGRTAGVLKRDYVTLT